MEAGEVYDYNKKVLYEDIGKRLREVRTHIGYTQEKMAEILQVSTTFYGKVERGKNSLSLEKFQRLYRELNVDITYIITGEKHTKYAFEDILRDVPKNKQYDFERLVEYALKLLE